MRIIQYNEDLVFSRLRNFIDQVIKNINKKIKN